MTERTASWHCHHDILCEWDSEPREVRIAFIKAEKPLHEQELRLRLYRPMSAEGCRLLARLATAREVWERTPEGIAWSDDYEAWMTRTEVWTTTRNAIAAAIEALHKLECADCPWDGTTIFP